MMGGKDNFDEDLNKHNLNHALKVIAISLGVQTSVKREKEQE